MEGASPDGNADSCAGTNQYLAHRIRKNPPQHLPAEGIFFLILKSWSDLFDYKAAPTIAGDQRDIGLTGIDLDLLTGLRIIVMCDSILGRLGPGNFDSLTLSNVVTGRPESMAL